MTIYGPMTVGRVTLTEDWKTTEKAGTSGRTLTLASQEASIVLGWDQTATRDRVEALLAMSGAVVPVTFTAGAYRDGWYRVGSVSSTDETLGTHTAVRWTVDLDRVGGDAEVEVESRLVGGARTNATATSPELWHAPPVGSDAYYVGTATPGHVDRVSADGTLTVYRALPAAANPRWGCPVSSWLLGAATVAVGGTVRAGTTCPDAPADWVLSNGLVRVEPRTTAGTVQVTSYLTGGWGAAKVFDVKRGTTSLGAADHVTILRNDPCECVVRLTWDHAPGRTTCDLSLKRGARHVSAHTQQYEASSSLRMDDNGVAGSVSDQLSAAGYIASAVDDGDGNRWVIGTSVAATAAGTFGLAADVSARSLPAHIGVVRAGASAVSGDAAADVHAQWLGTPSESERVIAR